MKYSIATFFLLTFLASLFSSCATYKPPEKHSPATATSTPTPAPHQALDLGKFGKGLAYDTAWSPDGSLFAVSSSEGLFVYDTSNWQVIKSDSSNVRTTWSEYKSLTFSPDGKSLIFIEGNNPTFRRYDLQSGQVTNWLERMSQNPDTSPLFSPDGKTFAFVDQLCSGTCENLLELHDTASGALLYSLRQDNSSQGFLINAFIFSPDGKRIAEGGDDHLIRVWDTTNGHLLFQFQHDSEVTSLSFSPDGNTLASASEDATVRFWNIQTGKCLYVLQGFDQGIQDVAFIDNGGKLLVGLMDNKFREYTLNNQYLPMKALDLTMDVGEVVYNPNNGSPSFFKMSLSPGTDKMATLVNDYVQLWDLQTGLSILTLPEYNSQINAMKFSPDSSLLAVADLHVHLWQMSTGKYLTTLNVNDGEIYALDFRPDGKQLAVSLYDGNIEIWDLTTDKKVQEFTTSSMYNLVAYLPDGTKLAVTGGPDVDIWDIKKGEIEQTFTSDAGQVFRLGFSSDGKSLYSIGDDVCEAWDTYSGKLLYEVKKPAEDLGGPADLSSNLCVIGGKNALLFFDPQTGRHLYDFSVENAEGPISLSLNGRLLARRPNDQIDLSDAISGKDLLSIPSLADLFVFSPDNRFLAVEEGVVQIWDISSFAQQAALLPPETPTPAPTPAPTAVPTQTDTFAPIAPLALQALPIPPMPANAINPGNIAKVEKLGEVGYGVVGAVAWSPDGRNLAVATEDSDQFTDSGIYIFPFGSKQPAHFLSSEDFVDLLAYSPDGHFLAGQISNYAIQVWNVDTGQAIYKFDDPACWNRHMSFSSDGQILTALCGDKTYQWNMQDGQVTGKSQANSSYTNDVNPDSSLTIQVGTDMVRLVDSASGNIIKTFDIPAMTPILAKFSPDGKTLLVWFDTYDVGRTGVKFPAGNSETLVQLWNIASDRTLTLRATLAGGKWGQDSLILQAYSGLSFTSDSLRFATASGDGSILIWNTNTGTLLETLSGGDLISFSPDGNRMVSAGGSTIQIWNVSPGSKPYVIWAVSGFGDYSRSLMFTSKGTELVTGPGFQLWPILGAIIGQTPTIVETSGDSPRLTAVSPDGKWLAYSTLNEVLLGENDSGNNHWQVLEKNSNPAEDTMDIIAGSAIVFSPDSSRLAVVDQQGKLLLWQVEQASSSPVELSADLFGATPVFSPDGRLLLASEPREFTFGKIYMWDVGSGKLLNTWNTHADQVAFHPNGVTLALSDDQTGLIQLRDLRTGNVLQTIRGSQTVHKIIFSPDGKLLVSLTENNIEIWDTFTGNLLKSLKGSFNQIAFSPDGRLLAISAGGKIQYWGLSAGQ